MFCAWGSWLIKKPNNIFLKTQSVKHPEEVLFVLCVSCYSVRSHSLMPGILFAPLTLTPEAFPSGLFIQSCDVYIRNAPGGLLPESVYLHIETGHSLGA